MATIRIKRGLYASRPLSGLQIGELYFFTDTKQIGIPYSSTQFAVFDIGTLFLKIANNLSDLNNVATARTNLNVYSKDEVDSMIVGMSWEEVDVASTANLTLSGEQTIDGKACVAGNTVLAKNQTDKTENGVYVVAAGAWTRATFADEASEIENLACIIQEGTQNGNTVWICTTKDITLNTTEIEFVELPGAAAIIAGTALDKSGNTINLDLTKLTESASPAESSHLVIYDAVNEEHRKVTIAQILAEAYSGLFQVKATSVDSLAGYLDDKLEPGVAIQISFPDSGTYEGQAVISLTLGGVTAHTTIDADNDEMIVDDAGDVKKATINNIIDAATIDGGTF